MVCCLSIVPLFLIRCICHSFIRVCPQKFYHDNTILIFLNRDCPDECKEAIPSLMYAAARFSDLPELRELRTLFTEKFGSVLEPYISKEVIDETTLTPIAYSELLLITSINYFLDVSTTYLNNCFFLISLLRS